ncbi:MAG: hypothetical protein KDE01_14345, partial [Caldilineaceae bacterium]|nr:hypothetical protein [Caldilineaceae bacterium]
ATGSLSMTNVAVLTNTATQDGGGIFAVSALTLTNVEVRGNTANVSTGNGGGIYASTAPSLTNISVLNNSAQIGGGLFLLADGALIGGVYQGNQATAAGGGVYAAGALSVNGASVLGNTATGNGGGIYAMGYISLTAATVTGNAAGENGGGVYAPAGTALSGGLVQANIAANTAAIDEGGGGGLYALAPVTMVDAQFAGNTVSGQGSGGGAYISATLALTNVQFLTNTVALTSTAGGGGAYAAGDITASGGLFRANDCAGDGCFGGALFATGALTMTGVDVRDNRASGSGGGVLVAGAAMIDGGTFQGNRSVDGVGGAIDALDLLTLDSVAVQSNTALNDGGAVYSLSEDVIATNSRFENNACTETDCLGGAMFTFQGAAVLTDTHFITNTADGAGGALSAAAATISGGLFQDNRCLAALCAGGALDSAGPLTVNDVQFINNSAGVGGAISVASSDPARIVNTLFARNSAVTGGAALYLASSDVVDILYSTVATPTLGANAAIYVDDGTVNITNTIVASYTTGIEVGLGGPVTSDYNLFYNAPTS